MIVVLCLVFAHSLCVEFKQRNCKLEVYVRDYYVWVLNCNLWLVRIVGLLANWYGMVWYGIIILERPLAQWATIKAPRLKISVSRFSSDFNAPVYMCNNNNYMLVWAQESPSSQNIVNSRVV